MIFGNRCVPVSYARIASPSASTRLPRWRIRDLSSRPSSHDARLFRYIANAEVAPRYLPRIQRLKEAIFHGSSSRPSWHGITSPSGSVHWLRSQWSRETAADSAARALRDTSEFNAFHARLSSLNTPIPVDIHLEGIVLAARRPVVLRTYMIELSQMPLKSRSSPEYKDKFAATLQQLVEIWTRTDGVDSPKWNDQVRLRCQYLEILTGWAGGMPTPAHRRKSSAIFEMIDELENTSKDSSAHPELWRLYIRMVGLHGGSQAVIAEWKYYKSRKFRATIFLRFGAMCNVIISEAIRLGDAKQAWKIALEAKEDGLHIESQTYTRLLAHPDGQTWWDSAAMEQPALQMLDEELVMVEEALGMSWVAADDGYHVAQVDPQ